MQYLEGCRPLKELSPMPPWTEAYNEAPSYSVHDSSSSPGTSIMAPLTDSAGSSFSSYSTQAVPNEVASYNGHRSMRSDSLSTAPKKINTALTGTGHSMSESPNANVDSASRWKFQYAQQQVQQIDQPPAAAFNSSKPSIFATQESQPLWHTAGFQTTPHVQQPWTMPAVATAQWHGASSLTPSVDSRSSQCQYCHKWVSRPSYTQEPTLGLAASQSSAVNQQNNGLRSPLDFSIPQDAKLQVNTAVAASEKSDRGTAGNPQMQWNVCGSASSRGDRSTSQETFISDRTSTSTSTNADTTNAGQVSAFYAPPSRASNDDVTHAKRPSTAEKPRTEHPHNRSKNRDRLDEKDRFLLKARLQGITYREIKATGHFHEAESTLRGRFRCLTKTKTQRVRQPHWTETDVSI